MSQTINIDLTPGLFMPTISYSQGDIGREIKINIQSSDGTEIPAGATVKMQATKPSGLGFSVSGTLTGNVATFVTTETMTNEWGRMPAELVLESGGVKIGTANFYWQGEKNPHPDGTTDGDSESLVPILTLLVERIEDAADSIHDLSVSATTLAPNTPATATYDDANNEIEFGIPRGAMLMAADDGDGNITLSFS